LGSSLRFQHNLHFWDFDFEKFQNKRNLKIEAFGNYENKITTGWFKAFETFQQTSGFPERARQRTSGSV
jgi:hypothetical protein